MAETIVFASGSKEVLIGQQVFVLNDGANCMECGIQMGDKEVCCVDDLFPLLFFVSI